MPKSIQEISEWLCKELSYDGDSQGRHWIYHKDSMTDNLMTWLGLWKGPGFPKGLIRDSLYRIFENAYVIGNRKQESEMLGREIARELWGVE